MRDFFKGWRRKAGVVLLVACAAGCSHSPPTSTPSTPENTARPRTESSSKVRLHNRKVMLLTDAAVAKFRAALEGNPGPDTYIRVSVKNEGPTGFMYDLQLENTPLTDRDFVDSSHGFQLVVDMRSSLFLEGATIDWVTDSDGNSGFKFDNPNAVKP